MRILVTAGNTQAPIDRVRCVTNIFTGKTGAAIALEAAKRGHTVRLLTSHPDTVGNTPVNRLTIQPYVTFQDLHDALAEHVRSRGLEAIVHCAAVSDYLCAGVYVPRAGTSFAIETGTWQGSPPVLIDRSASKVKSDATQLWLRLTRAPKLVDKMRSEWGFQGTLVKFKLEVGLSEEELLQVAERSRQQSAANLMVANTLEGAAEWALLGPLGERYERIPRSSLSARLLDAVEALHG